PVWHELMTALHRNRPSLAPQPPPGVVMAATRFKSGVEAPRSEWFTKDQQTASTATMALAQPMPRIVSPANGMVIAVDPDIPVAYQKLPISVEGASRGMRLKLNNHQLARAD